jgi:two-component SAPR family response regulator
MQALALEDIIVALGGSVPAIACGFERAMQALDGVEFDCAILDVNLSGTLSFAIAARLQQRSIPFVFCTAYADAAKVFTGKKSVVCLDKPVEKVALRDTVLGLLKEAAQKVSTQ